MKFSLYTLLLILTSACSFNKMFLQPTKIPPSTEALKFQSNADTISVSFQGEHHQPSFTNPQNDTIDLGFTIESVIYKSENGNALNGWFMKPKHGHPTTTILHFHGNAGCLLSQFQAMSPLIDKGFQIFIFDYSGFGFSEGKATKKNVLIDANSTLDYLKKREDVKNTKFILYGQSLGGHLSAVVAAKRQDEIDGLVIEGAFSSHKDIAAHTIPILGRIFVKQNYSAKKSIQDFQKPVLIIHSSEDAVIPLFMGKLLYDAANSPKEFYEIKQCHMCGPEYYSEEISVKIFRMLGVQLH